MREVATIHITQYGKYRLSAINNIRSQSKIRECLLEFKVKFKKSSDICTVKGLGRNHFFKKQRINNFRLSL